MSKPIKVEGKDWRMWIWYLTTLALHELHAFAKDIEDDNEKARAELVRRHLENAAWELKR